MLEPIALNRALPKRCPLVNGSIVDLVTATPAAGFTKAPLPETEEPATRRDTDLPDLAATILASGPILPVFLSPPTHSSN